MKLHPYLTAALHAVLRLAPIATASSLPNTNHDQALVANFALDDIDLAHTSKKCNTFFEVCGAAKSKPTYVFPSFIGQDSAVFERPTSTSTSITTVTRTRGDGMDDAGVGGSVIRTTSVVFFTKSTVTVTVGTTSAVEDSTQTSVGLSTGTELWNEEEDEKTMVTVISTSFCTVMPVYSTTKDWDETTTTLTSDSSPSSSTRTCTKRLASSTPDSTSTTKRKITSTIESTEFVETSSAVQTVLASTLTYTTMDMYSGGAKVRVWLTGLWGMVLVVRFGVFI